MSHNQHASSLTNQYSIFYIFVVYILVHLKRLGNISNLNVVNISGGLGDQIIPDPSVVTNTAQSGGDLGHAGGSPDLNIGQFLLQFPCIGMTTKGFSKGRDTLRAGPLETVTRSEGLGADYKGRPGSQLLPRARNISLPSPGLGPGSRFARVRGDLSVVLRRWRYSDPNYYDDIKL